ANNAHDKGRAGLLGPPADQVVDAGRPTRAKAGEAHRVRALVLQRLLKAAPGPVYVEVGRRVGVENDDDVLPGGEREVGEGHLVFRPAPAAWDAEHVHVGVGVAVDGEL